MKKLLLLALLTFCAYSQALAQSGPVAHWKMNGNAADSSGNNHHGFAANVTPTTGRAGQPNSALYFNGLGNSFISVPTSNAFNAQKFTICATVRATAFNSGQCQISTILQRGPYFS